MIHSITFKNFFSFKDEGVLSLVVNDKAPQTEKYFATETGERVSKVLSVFGYNASGKTNALKPITFLQWLMNAAYTENPEEKIFFSPFGFTNEKLPTEISVQFSVGKDLYFYDVKLTTEKVISEKLQKKSIDKIKFKTLFERVWDDKEKNNYVWKDNFGLGTRFQDRLRKNASVLATAIRDNHKESIKIFDFWRKINANVAFAGKVDGEAETVFEAANFFNDNPILKNKADILLKKFDLGLSAIEIKKGKDGKHESFEIHGIHHGNYHLSFVFESSGTKKLFVLLKNILNALENGGVAVLDEFDTDLHPMMSEALLNMFFSQETNPHNAQLIFSAHSPHLLNLLDKYQIALTEKNEKGESEIWRLDEVKGVRLDDNYYAKYLSGAYGGVPDLDL